MPEESDHERRLREAAVTKATRQPPEPTPEEAEQDDASRHRVEQQHLWVDHQIRAAMARGEFDNLPGAGKPLKLPDRHDPDWWVKGLIERERLTGVLPPAFAVRKEDAELDGRLDRLATEREVRAAVEDFNARVVDARRQLQGGPPVVTPTRDVDAEVERWLERRRVRRTRRAEQRQAARDPQRRRRWWHRRDDG